MAESTYTYDRASFAERAAKLAGVTTFREPVGGRGTRRDQTPDEHSIAAAFAYARKMIWDEQLGEYVPDPHDVGPDIAIAIITGQAAHRQKIVTELAAALMSGLGRRSKGCAESIIYVAADCYMRVVTGKGIGKPEGMGDKPYEIARTLGDCILWRAADEAMHRAERAYRMETRPSPETRLQSSCT